MGDTNATGWLVAAIPGLLALAMAVMLLSPALRPARMHTGLARWSRLPTRRKLFDMTVSTSLVALVVAITGWSSAGVVNWGLVAVTLLVTLLGWAAVLFSGRVPPVPARS